MKHISPLHTDSFIAALAPLQHLNSSQGLNVLLLIPVAWKFMLLGQYLSYLLKCEYLGYLSLLLCVILM